MDGGEVQAGYEVCRSQLATAKGEIAELDVLPSACDALGAICYHAESI